MNEIDIFDAQFGKIRTFEEQGEILFVAVDVAKALGYSNTNHAVNTHCTLEFNQGVAFRDPLKLEASLLDENGKRQTYRLINEPNLYKLIFASKLQSAKQFTQWVACEVLPSLRKYGQYPAPDPVGVEKGPEPLALENHSLKEKVSKMEETMASLTANPRPKLIKFKHELLMEWVKNGWLEHRESTIIKHHYKLTKQGKEFLTKTATGRIVEL